MSAEKQDNILITPEMKEEIEHKARDMARNAKWDLNIAIFLFAVLILVIILVNYAKVGLELVGPIAAIGLGLVWFTGWQRGKQLYKRFYNEELAKLERDLKKTTRDAITDKIAETIEEQVQKALRARWKS
jgi:uncharacterized integral membrane protein